MKKFLALILALALIFCTFACSDGDKDKDNNNDDDNNTETIVGDISNWVLTSGGKKWEFPATVGGSDYYTDSAKTQTSDGILFSGSGGYWAKESNAGAGCGGTYDIELDIKDAGFKIEFTVNEIFQKYSTNVGGVWDTWIGISFMNKIGTFSNIADPENNYNLAKGYVFRLIPLSEKGPNNSEMSVFINERGNEFINRGDYPIENKSLMDRSHTFELVKDEDELGVYYKMYFDGLLLETQIQANRFNEFFPDGKAYISMLMQTWNVNPKEEDTDDLKNYGLNKFTLNSLTVGETKIDFSL